MYVLESLNFTSLISRKIWITEKSWNFHTVLTQPQEGRLNVYVSPSALKLYVSPVFDNDVLDDDMEAPDEK